MDEQSLKNFTEIYLPHHTQNDISIPWRFGYLRDKSSPENIFFSVEHALVDQKMVLPRTRQVCQQFCIPTYFP